jgi:hypothetical protein
LFHLTVAIARFFEFLLLDIVKSIAALVVLGMVALAGGVAAVLALRKIGRGAGKR